MGRRKVYMSDDGTIFFNETDCKIWNNIKYFVVHHSPDICETGYMQNLSVVAVYSPRFCHKLHKEIVENWCVKEMNMPILQPSVQGFGFQEGFRISDNKEYCKRLWKEYRKDEMVNPDSSFLIPCFKEKVFLSPIEVEGFPKPFNYMEKWGFKL